MTAVGRVLQMDDDVLGWNHDSMKSKFKSGTTTRKPRNGLFTKFQSLQNHKNTARLYRCFPLVLVQESDFLKAGLHEYENLKLERLAFMWFFCGSQPRPKDTLVTPGVLQISTYFKLYKV